MITDPRVQEDHVTDGFMSVFEVTIDHYEDQLELTLFDVNGVPTTLEKPLDWTYLPETDQISLTVVPTANQTLRVETATLITQETDYILNDSLPPDVLEESLDKLTIISKQVENKVVGALSHPDADAAGRIFLPTAVDRAGKMIKYDGSGDPYMVEALTADGSLVVSTLGESLVQAIDADAAKTILEIQAPLTGNVTVALSSASSVAEMQTQINAVPKDLNGYQLTVELDIGAYLLSSGLTFEDFHNGYLYFDMSSAITVIYSGVTGYCFTFERCQEVVISNTDVTCSGSGNFILFDQCGRAYFSDQTLSYSGSGTMHNFIHFKDCPSGFAGDFTVTNDGSGTITAAVAVTTSVVSLENIDSASGKEPQHVIEASDSTIYYDFEDLFIATVSLTKETSRPGTVVKSQKVNPWSGTASFTITTVAELLNILENLPKDLGGTDVAIKLTTGTYTIADRVDIKGFYNGSISIDALTMAATSTLPKNAVIESSYGGTLGAFIRFSGCSCPVTVEGLEFVSGANGAIRAVEMDGCIDATVSNCGFSGVNFDYAVLFTNSIGSILNIGSSGTHDWLIVLAASRVHINGIKHGVPTINTVWISNSTGRFSYTGTLATDSISYTNAVSDCIDTAGVHY